MTVKHRVRTVALLLLALLLVPVLSLTRYQVLDSPGLAERPGNPRRLENLALRGSLLDRRGAPLAQTREGRRHYPLGEAAAPLVGYLTPRLGAAGLEGLVEERIVGRPIPRTPAEAVQQIARNSRRGDDLVLTLDAALQEEAFRLLQGHRGAAVVLDVPTGEILAAASRPSFSPAAVEEDWDRLRSDPEAPLVERATQGLYPPGSSLKILVMAAALVDDLTRASETFPCTGSLPVDGFVLNDNGVHGSVGLEEALVVSCNVAFAGLGLRLEVEGLRRWMDRFHMTAAPDLVPGAQQGLPPATGRGPTAAAEAGIGQADMLLTPLAMARLAATFARGGQDLPPRLLRAQVRGKEITWKPKAGIPERVVPPEVAAQVAAAMRGVVARGTGGGASVPGVEVAGKTGTAENPHGPAHAWFVGYAPAADPQVAVAVILENAGGGGAVAAPIASRLIDAALSRL